MFSSFIADWIGVVSMVGIAATPAHGPLSAVAGMASMERDSICHIPRINVDPVFVEEVLRMIRDEPVSVASTVGLLGSPLGQGPVLAAAAATQRKHFHVFFTPIDGRSGFGGQSFRGGSPVLPENKR